MHPSALLLHTLPDGSSHYDWMIARPGGGGLITFRVRERIDGPEVHGFDAERLPDHRAVYLTYEGEVSGARGRVSRVSEGEFEFEIETPDALRIRGRLGERRARFAGARTGGALWSFRIEPTG